MDWITRLDSPVGELTLASDGTALTGLWIAGQKYHSLGLEPGAREARLPVFEAAAGWLESYFAGERPDPGRLTLAPARQRVQAQRLEEAAGYTQRRAHDLRRHRPQAGRFGAGGGRRRGSQPHFYNHPLPPRDRRKRQTHRICRRSGCKTPAAPARGPF